MKNLFMKMKFEKGAGCEMLQILDNLLSFSGKSGNVPETLESR